MKISISLFALVAASSASAFTPVNRIVLKSTTTTSLYTSKNGNAAAAAIAEAKAASQQYGASSPEAALAWEGTSI
jgi:hypothetical protein